MNGNAENEAEKIRRLLKTQGFCFLTCEFLGNETLAVLRDNPPLRDFERERLEKQAAKIKAKKNLPDDARGIVCYKMAEFLVLLDDPSPRLLHEAKKQGAEIGGASGFED